MPENRPDRKTNSLTGAIILIVIGLFLILQRLGISGFKNWWAIFILIPSISSTGNLVREIRSAGGFHFSMASNVLGILFPAAVAFMFMFELDWGLYWPIFIMLAGVSMILTGFIGEDAPVGNFVRRYRPWLISWGSGVILFGVFYFINNIQKTNFQIFESRLLGIPILIASLGGIFSILFAQKLGVASKTFILLNLITTFFLALPGILAILNLQLQIVGALLIIALGLLIILGVVQKNGN